MGFSAFIAGLVGWAAFGPLGGLAGAWLGHKLDERISGTGLLQPPPSPPPSRARSFATPRGVISDAYGQIATGSREGNNRRRW